MVSPFKQPLFWTDLTSFVCMCQLEYLFDKLWSKGIQIFKVRLKCPKYILVPPKGLPKASVSFKRKTFNLLSRRQQAGKVRAPSRTPRPIVRKLQIKGHMCTCDLDQTPNLPPTEIFQPSRLRLAAASFSRTLAKEFQSALRELVKITYLNTFTDGIC